MATVTPLITISAHPDLKEVSRKVRIVSTNVEDDNNRVVMSLYILHDYKGKPQPKLDGIVYLYAENDQMVHPQTGADAVGVLNAKNELVYPQGSIGEYDFLYYLIDNNLGNFLRLREQYVIKREDKINEKLYK